MLATGDFRYTPAMFEDNQLKSKEIEVVYLDNTYFNYRFAEIPTREEALKRIISLIESKRDMQKNGVLFRIRLRYLGKENLLVDLSEYFETKIG